MTDIVYFTTASDVAEQFSDHKIAFANEESWNAACREVWQATDWRGRHFGSGGGQWWIDRETGNQIINTNLAKWYADNARNPFEDILYANHADFLGPDSDMSYRADRDQTHFGRDL